MENKRVNFELSSKQIKYKDILNKEFLELEIWAISDINPNRNKTHFTLEAMKNAIPNMKNKPIVGFFEKGDFVEHNGYIDYDQELEKAYWNTEKGERILGWIRESDPIEIVEKDGLNWIKFKCVLCVQYCYKQVRRLLKDKHKKVSVEITVHKSEKIGDIEEILDFTLNGVTILGSRNGKPVVEAIPDAHLSVLENLDDEFFNDQRRVLSFAYKQIDETIDDKENIEKEESTQMEEQLTAQTPEVDTVELTTVAAEEAVVENNSVVTEETNGEAVVNECNSCDGEKNSCDCGCEGNNPDELIMTDAVVENNDTTTITTPAGNETVDPEATMPQPEAVENLLEQARDPKDEEIEKLHIRVAELESACEGYVKEIDDLRKDLDDKQQQFADYSEIKDRMEIAEKKVWQHYCDELKTFANQTFAINHVTKEDKDVIMAKCENGEYATKEDLEKEIAFAIYKCSSTSKEEMFSVELPIKETESNKGKATMSREERIAARNKSGK